MALTAAQRERGWRWWVDHRSANPEAAPVRFTKPELRAAMDAMVTWLEANQASAVAALSGTAMAGANSTADEKLRIFLAALAARYDIMDLS